MRLNIGFVSQPFDYSGPPDPGTSIGIWNWEISRRFAESCRVTVAGPRRKDGPAKETWAKVNFRRFPLAQDHRLGFVMRRFARFLPRQNVPDFAAHSYYPIYARRAAKAFSDANCDIVHIHQFSQWAPIIRGVCPRAKIVLHMHSDWLVQLKEEIVRERLRQVDAIVSCSDYVTRRIRGVFPEYGSRCSTVYNGVDTEEIQASFERRLNHQLARVLFVSRVSPEKGVHVLLDAFKKVVKRRPDARLDIIGGEFIPPREFIIDMTKDPMVRDLARFYGSSYLQYLREQVEKNELGKHVNFLGHIPRHELVERLQQADLFVQPSIASEMFGMGVAEAMAAGVPVVATKICGLPEVVEEGKTGFLVAPDDREALADAIVHLLDDFCLSQQMSRAARARAERMFTWESAVETLKRVYQSIYTECGFRTSTNASA